MIAIIDIGIGNVRSVKLALDYLKQDSIVTSDINNLKNCSKLILPGVGHFQKGISNLKKLGLIEFLYEEVVINNKNILGICLGMQLMFKESQEGAHLNKNIKGLGFLDGSVIRIRKTSQEIIIPHVGWNSVYHKQSKLYDTIPQDSDFYFIHGYMVNMNFDSKYLKIATTKYGQNILASFEYNNIMGTQFHPEKSQSLGLKLLSNFCELC